MITPSVCHILPGHWSRVQWRRGRVSPPIQGSDPGIQQRFGGEAGGGERWVTMVGTVCSLPGMKVTDRIQQLGLSQVRTSPQLDGKEEGEGKAEPGRAGGCGSSHCPCWHGQVWFLLLVSQLPFLHGERPPGSQGLLPNSPSSRGALLYRLPSPQPPQKQTQRSPWMAEISSGVAGKRQSPTLCQASRCFSKLAMYCTEEHFPKAWGLPVACLPSHAASATLQPQSTVSPEWKSTCCPHHPTTPPQTLIPLHLMLPYDHFWNQHSS